MASKKELLGTPVSELKLSKKELNELSTADLEKRIQDLETIAQEVRDHQVAAHAVLDDKIAEEAARARLESMSEPERAALLQILQAEGVETSEASGTPQSG